MAWAVSNGVTREPRRIKVTLTHEEIAEMIGTARETVTRLSQYPDPSRHRH